MAHSRLFLLIGLLLSVGLRANATASYRCVDLGVGRHPLRVNNSGQVLADGLWSPATGWQALPVNGFGLNNLGQVAGAYGDSCAWWDPNTGVHVLGRPGWLVDISDAGVVVGQGRMGDGSTAPFWFYQGNWSGGWAGEVYDVTDTGYGSVTVGSIASYLGLTYGTLAQGGMLHFFYVSGDWVSIVPRSVNEQGMFAGFVQYRGGSSRQAALWYDEYTHVSLGPGEARGISGASDGRFEVVGTTGGRAFVWDSISGMRDLNDLVSSGAQLTLAVSEAVNDSGWIIGTAYDSSGVEHGFLLQPVPEPGSIAAVLVGLAGIPLVRRRAC